MPNKENLIFFEPGDEAREKGREGGIASGKARRAKKSLKKSLEQILNMQLKDEKAIAVLKNNGIDDEDMTYQTAVAVKLIRQAIKDGNPGTVRLIAELTGQLSRFGVTDFDDADISGIIYPAICIPDNGRDKRDKFELAPQAGPQTMFMASSADIVIYGGAAGGGKTYALLLEGLRHKNVKGFGAVIFRKNYTQITNEGGLWQASHKLYDMVPGALPKKTPKLHWEFPAGANVGFAHIERDDDLQGYQGSEICYIGFDELTHFTKHQFFYMLSRNRSTCGVKPYVRATCNPDADSWVADMIEWWIDRDTGYPIPERSGVIRWMIHYNNVINWFDTKAEAVAYALDLGVTQDKAEIMPKSVTFIASKLDDNKKLMESDPNYLANLMALAEVDKERLLNGNWKIKPAAGRYFKRAQANIIETVPDDIIMWCRAWDLAATSEDENGDADYTASVLMGKRRNGRIVILNVTNDRINAGDVEKLVYNVSLADKSIYGFNYIVRIPQDPGQAGKVLAKHYIELLSGFNIKCLSVSGSKELRATPMATQWQHGNIDVLAAEWNDMYFSQLESFPESKHDDMVDAGSDAFNELADFNYNIDNLL